MPTLRPGRKVPVDGTGMNLYYYPEFRNLAPRLEFMSDFVEEYRQEIVVCGSDGSVCPDGTDILTLTVIGRIPDTGKIDYETEVYLTYAQVLMLHRAFGKAIDAYENFIWNSETSKTLQLGDDQGPS